MKLIPPSPIIPDHAARIAEEIVESVNGGLDSKVRRLYRTWEKLWESPEATPEEIFAKLGTRGGMVFDYAEKAILEIAALASDLGLPLTDVIQPKYLAAKYPYSRHESGLIALLPRDA